MRQTVYLFATLRLPSLKQPENHLTGYYDHIQPLENNANCPISKAFRGDVQVMRLYLIKTTQ